MNSQNSPSARKSLLKKEELDFLSQEYHHVDTQKFRINEGIKVSPKNVGGVIVVGENVATAFLPTQP